MTPKLRRPFLYKSEYPTFIYSDLSHVSQPISHHEVLILNLSSNLNFRRYSDGLVAIVAAKRRHPFKADTSHQVLISINLLVCGVLLVSLGLLYLIPVFLWPWTR